MKRTGLLCLPLLATAVACGGSQTPPPCTVTTVLIPEEEVLQRVRYTYDDDDRVVGSQVLLGGREQSVEVVTVQYDDEGRLASETIAGADDQGRPQEQLVLYAYDDHDRLVARDWLIAGVVNHGETYTYDPDDQLIETTHYGAPPDAGVERIIRQTYTSDGLLASTETDVQGDGTVESRVRYTYDDSDQIVTMTFADATESTTVLTTYHYDEDGRLLSEEDDVGADGSVESVRRSLYDEEGVLVGVEMDESNDGTTERRIEYAYDDEERLITETDLVSERGSAPSASRSVTSSRTEYDYSCWDER